MIKVKNKFRNTDDLSDSVPEIVWLCACSQWIRQGCKQHPTLQIRWPGVSKMVIAWSVLCPHFEVHPSPGQKKIDSKSLRSTVRESLSTTSHTSSKMFQVFLKSLQKILVFHLTQGCMVYLLWWVTGSAYSHNKLYRFVTGHCSTCLHHHSHPN